MKSTPGDDAVNIPQITTKDFEYYANLSDKEAAGFEETDSGLGKFSLWVKRYQIASHATEKSFVKGIINRFDKFHCCLILRNCDSDCNLQQPPP
jgi:hypothetical protein